MWSQSRGRARVDKIVFATIELLREHGPQDITIAMIATRANIIRSSIYAHFKNVNEVFEEISGRFVEQSSRRSIEYVLSRNPKTLSEVITLVVDSICSQFNRSGHEDSIENDIYVPIDVVNVIKDLDKQSAQMYRSLVVVNWPIEPLSEFDPFRILTILQLSLFSTSMQRHGYITPEFAEQAKRVALDFIEGTERRFRDARAAGDAPLVESRVSRAIAALTSSTDPRLVEIGVRQLETLATLAEAPSGTPAARQD